MVTMKNQKRSKAIINIDINWGLPIPTHMAPLIFSKLSISHLPVCRCICKSWNHLVLDYARNPFSKSHLPNSLIISTSSNSGFLDPKVQCFDINTFTFVATSTLDQPIPNDSISLNNCCNGLLYITKLWSNVADGCDPGIFNPMTHEFFSIPNFRDPPHALYQGFGFSIKTKEYKIFKAYSKSRCELNVLRLGNNHNQWTTISLPSPITIGSQGVYMNGVIYWIGIDNDTRYFKNIYALDVQTENFEEMVLEVGPAYKGRLQLFNGTIYAIIYEIKPIFEIQFWKMRSKDSWIKDFVIPGKFKKFKNYLDLYLIKDFEDGKILVKMNNSLFWLKDERKIEKNYKIKTLIPSTRKYAYFHFCLLDSLHFGSLSSILAGMDDQSF